MPNEGWASQFEQTHAPYESLISANQNDRKLDVKDRKLKGSHSNLA